MGASRPPCYRQLELESLGRLQVLDDYPVRRGKPPAPKTCVSNEQAVEWVSRPAQFHRGIEPGGSRRIIEQPAIVLNQRRNCPARQPKASRFDEKLQFEDGNRRHIQRLTCLGEGAGPSVPTFEPQQGVGVEQDHFRRVSRNAIFPGSQPQVHCPAATAGSRMVTIDFRFRGRRAGRSALREYRTPFRSMTTGTPLSAWSSASASRSRTWLTVYRFMAVHCTGRHTLPGLKPRPAAARPNAARRQA